MTVTATPRGLALVLILLGTILAVTAAVASLATGERRLVALTAAGCALHLAGWLVHTHGNGGAR